MSINKEQKEKSTEDDNKREETRKKPEKITDPLEDEGLQDDQSSRDLDTPLKDKD